MYFVEFSGSLRDVADEEERKLEIGFTKVRRCHSRLTKLLISQRLGKVMTT